MAKEQEKTTVQIPSLGADLQDQGHDGRSQLSVAASQMTRGSESLGDALDHKHLSKLRAQDTGLSSVPASAKLNSSTSVKVSAPLSKKPRRQGPKRQTANGIQSDRKFNNRKNFNQRSPSSESPSYIPPDVYAALFEQKDNQETPSSWPSPDRSSTDSSQASREGCSKVGSKSSLKQVPPKRTRRGFNRGRSPVTRELTEQIANLTAEQKAISDIESQALEVQKKRTRMMAFIAKTTRQTERDLFSCIYSVFSDADLVEGKTMSVSYTSPVISQLVARLILAGWPLVFSLSHPDLAIGHHPDNNPHHIIPSSANMEDRCYYFDEVWLAQSLDYTCYNVVEQLFGEHMLVCRSSTGPDHLAPLPAFRKFFPHTLEPIDYFVGVTGPCPLDLTVYSSAITDLLRLTKTASELNVNALYMTLLRDSNCPSYVEYHKDLFNVSYLQAMSQHDLMFRQRCLYSDRSSSVEDKAITSITAVSTGRFHASYRMALRWWESAKTFCGDLQDHIVNELSSFSDKREPDPPHDARPHGGPCQDAASPAGIPPSDEEDPPEKQEEDQEVADVEAEEEPIGVFQLDDLALSTLASLGSLIVETSTTVVHSTIEVLLKRNPTRVGSLVYPFYRNVVAYEHFAFLTSNWSSEFYDPQQTLSRFFTSNIPMISRKHLIHCVSAEAARDAPTDGIIVSHSACYHTDYPGSSFLEVARAKYQDASRVSIEWQTDDCECFVHSEVFHFVFFGIAGRCYDQNYLPLAIVSRLAREVKQPQPQQLVVLEQFVLESHWPQVIEFFDDIDTEDELQLYIENMPSARQKYHREQFALQFLPGQPLAKLFDSGFVKSDEIIASSNKGRIIINPPTDLFVRLAPMLRSLKTTLKNHLFHCVVNREQWRIFFSYGADLDARGKSLWRTRVVDLLNTRKLTAVIIVGGDDNLCYVGNDRFLLSWESDVTACDQSHNAGLIHIMAQLLRQMGFDEWYIDRLLPSYHRPIQFKGMRVTFNQPQLHTGHPQTSVCNTLVVGMLSIFLMDQFFAGLGDDLSPGVVCKGLLDDFEKMAFRITSDLGMEWKIQVHEDANQSTFHKGFWVPCHYGHYDYQWLPLPSSVWKTFKLRTDRRLSEAEFWLRFLYVLYQKRSQPQIAQVARLYDQAFEQLVTLCNYEEFTPAVFKYLSQDFQQRWAYRGEVSENLGVPQYAADCNQDPWWDAQAVDEFMEKRYGFLPQELPLQLLTTYPDPSYTAFILRDYRDSSLGEFLSEHQ